MKTIFTLALLGLAVIGNAQYNSKNLTIKETATTGFTYKNLRLFPIYANETFMNAHKDLGKYMSLQKALEQKKVAITETVNNSNGVQTGSATVNTLFIENTSSDTIFLMAGEIVKGGQQDRVLAQDMILSPKSGKKDISVFCVEHGRWSYTDESEQAGKKFYGYSKVTSNNIRKTAIVDKSQQGVWDKVANVTAKNEASTETGTYTALDTSKKYNNELNGYTDYFKSAMKSEHNVIGVVACSGDKVIGCDMFATPVMFNEHLEGLLNAYSTEAMTNGSQAKADYSKVQSYLDNILSDESKQDEKVSKNGTMLKSKDKKLHIATF
jgi:hypothetical protein